MLFGFDASRAFSDHRTGTENYSYQLLTHLAQIDTINKYYVYLRPGNMVGHGWPPNLKFKIINLKLLWTQLGLAARTLSDPLDLLFVPSHTLPLIRRSGLKTVVTVHDLGAEFLPQTHQLKQRLYLNFMTHHQLKSATHLIAVSEATKADLVKKVGIDPKIITVIYEGVDLSRFRPTQGDVQKLGVRSGNYFLFVGTIQPRKNLERLIKAYAQYLKMDDRRWKMVVEDRKLKLDQKDPSSNFYPQNTTFYPPTSTVPILVLAGSKGWLSAEIYRLPKQLGIEDYVQFLGFFPDADLPLLYSRAQALLFPSLFEGFGLTVLEAQACKCPVLTSNVSSLPEVAGKAAILVNPYSVESITEGISRIQNRAVRIKLKTLGQQQVKKFSWEKCAQQTLRVLEEVAGK